MRTLAARYLHRREWTIGNGQCHACYGLGPRFRRNPRGHLPDCKIALALDEAKYKVLWAQSSIKTEMERRVEAERLFPKKKRIAAKSGILKTIGDAYLSAVKEVYGPT